MCVISNGKSMYYIFQMKKWYVFEIQGGKEWYQTNNRFVRGKVRRFSNCCLKRKVGPLWSTFFTSSLFTHHFFKSNSFFISLFMMIRFPHLFSLSPSFSDVLPLSSIFSLARIDYFFPLAHHVNTNPRDWLFVLCRTTNTCIILRLWLSSTVT